jgi:hypothetical protein
VTTGSLTSWRCDSYAEAITDPTMAFVAWRSTDRQFQDFQLVHKSVDGRTCDPGVEAGFRESLDLDAFLGLVGLVRLLARLSAGPVRNYPGYNRVRDLDQYVDLFRRVQAPSYEEARPYIGDEETHHLFGDPNEISPYVPDILEYVARQGTEPAATAS